MTLLTFVSRALTLLEDDDLVTFALRNDFTNNSSAFNNRRANCDVVAFAEHQHFVECVLITFVSVDFLDGDFVIGGHFVLFAASLDDCVHRADPLKKLGFTGN